MLWSVLLLLSSLSSPLLAVEFTHFPPVTTRSDNVPLPQVEVRPTGRPGLLDLHQKEELIALMAAPDIGQERPAEARPRQKMSRMVEEERWSRSPPSSPSPGRRPGRRPTRKRTSRKGLDLNVVNRNVNLSLSF